jgi:hypothetical protein
LAILTTLATTAIDSTRDPAIDIVAAVLLALFRTVQRLSVGGSAPCCAT